MSAWLLIIVLGGAPADPQAPDTAVVCPPKFLSSLQPWLVHRERQGHRIAYVPAGRPANEIHAELAEIHRQGALKAVLLIGDADPAAARDPAIRARCTPAFHVPAKVNIKWGSEPEIATDNPYADFNGDSVPDVAIGRLPADSPEELARLIRKTLDYEKSTDFGAWRNRVNLVAGVGGFGALVDTILETATKKIVCDGIPSTYSTSMTYGSWRSPYCPDPRRFHAAAVQRLTEGSLFWVYIGHGHPYQLDRVQVPGASYPIFSVGDTPKLRGGTPPIAVLLACYTAAYDAPRDCLAEELLRADGGPVAALGGSRVTMPYAMAVLSHGLIEETFKKRRETLGEILLVAKQRLVADEQDDAHRQIVDALAAAVSPAPDMLPDERREHLALFNLLGDPLLRIHHPDTVAVAPAVEDLEAGQTLEITARSPLAGKCEIELVCRRDRLRNDPPDRPKFDPAPDSLARLDQDYRDANDRRWLVKTVDLKGPGAITVPLAVPADAHGPCHVIVRVAGERTFALGACDVFVRRLRAPKAE